MKFKLKIDAMAREVCLDCVHGLMDNERDQGCEEGHAMGVAEVLKRRLESLTGDGGELELSCHEFGLLSYVLEVWGERRRVARRIVAAIKQAPDVFIVGTPVG